MEGIEKTAFETFAALHPIEAHQLNKQKFCDYVREKICSDLKDEEIEKLLLQDKSNIEVIN